MKTTFISLIALGVAAALAGPADRAQAGEPMVLTDAELDQVTAGDLDIFVKNGTTVIIESDVKPMKIDGFLKVPSIPGPAIVEFSVEPASERGNPR